MRRHGSSSSPKAADDAAHAAHESTSGAASPAEARVDAIVRRTSIVSAVLAGVLSPIPLADEVALLPVYAVMSVRIGTAHGVRAGKLPWKAIMTATGVGLAARATVNLAVAWIPGVAAAANAASAVALTQVLGRYVGVACADPVGARAPSMAEMVGALKGVARPAR